MKNWEKYEDSVMNTRGCFGVTEEGKAIRCYSLKCGECIPKCRECIFASVPDCVTGRLNWLYSEYVPTKRKLTPREKVLVDSLHEEAYIARDKSGTLKIFTYYPEKGQEWWESAFGHVRIEKNLFQFITWNDERPWSLADLKALEVEE